VCIAHTAGFEIDGLKEMLESKLLGQEFIAEVADCSPEARAHVYPEILLFAVVLMHGLQSEQAWLSWMTAGASRLRCVRDLFDSESDEDTATTLAQQIQAYERNLEKCTVRYNLIKELIEMGEYDQSGIQWFPDELIAEL